MLSRKIVPVFSASLLFVAFSALGQTPGTGPINYGSITRLVLPPVGLASSETAQVNIVNDATVPASGTVGAVPGLAAVPSAQSCTGSVAFYNASGSMIGAASSFTILSRQVFSVALPYASAGTTGTRTVVRAEIIVTPLSPIPPPSGGPSAMTIPCTLSSSIETYDSATGITHAFAPGVPAPSLFSVLLAGAISDVPVR